MPLSATFILISKLLGNPREANQNKRKEEEYEGSMKIIMEESENEKDSPVKNIERRSNQKKSPVNQPKGRVSSANERNPESREAQASFERSKKDEREHFKKETLVKNLSCDFDSKKREETTKRNSEGEKPAKITKDTRQEAQRTRKTGNGESGSYSKKNGGMVERKSGEIKEEAWHVFEKTIKLHQARPENQEVKSESSPGKLGEKSKSKEMLELKPKGSPPKKALGFSESRSLKEQKETQKRLNNGNKADNDSRDSENKEGLKLGGDFLEKTLEFFDKKDNEIRELAARLINGPLESQDILRTHLELLLRHMSVSCESFDSLV